MVLPDELLARAALQGGPFTRAQLADSGLSDWQVRRALAEDCVELRHGVHLERSRATADEKQRLVLQGAAAVLVRRGSVLSHRTAAVVHGLPLLGALPVRPELTRCPTGKGDTSSVQGLRVADLPAEHRTEVGGVPVTTLARTVVDVARRHPERDGLVVADAALGRGLDPAELAAVAAACVGWPGGRKAQRVVRFADGRAETPLESITRLAYREQGLPPPETQVEVWAPDGTFLGLVDFLWRAQRVVGEADGLSKYDVAGALRKEKLREEGLRRGSLEVVRNVWDDVWPAAGRRELGRRVREGFSYALTRPLVPGLRFVVPSLAELRRRRERAAGVVGG